MNDTLTPEKLTELVVVHYPGLLSILRSKVPRREWAADCLQQAVVTTIESIRAGRLTEPQQVPGHLYLAALNHARNYLRNMDNRPNLHLPVLPDTLLTAFQQHDAGGLQAERLAHAARDLLESLNSPRDRDIIKRYYLDEEDKESICQDFGLSSLRFNHVISRARQRLKDLAESKGLSVKDFLPEP